MPLPIDWNDFIFPAFLRNPPIGRNRRANWRFAYGKARRSYILNFVDAAISVDRIDVAAIKEGLSPRFKEDPRRYIPLEGWREHLKPDGEHFIERNYTVPPICPAHGRCGRWGPFGKAQSEHAFHGRPLNLFSALKVVAALYDAQDQAPHLQAPTSSADGLLHNENQGAQLSIHPAIFYLEGFNVEYYNEHFINDADRRRRFARHAHLRSHANDGTEAPTLFEMAHGLNVTWRTANALVSFIQSEGLPELTEVVQDQSTRGADRDTRIKVKAKRKGQFKGRSYDCAIELFQLS